MSGDAESALSGDAGRQPTLAGLAVPHYEPSTLVARTAADEAPPDDPVAEVVVDSHLAHLDRPFEYAVPAELDEVARPGVRVRVRFAGRAVDGYLIGRKASAEHTGRLAPLLKVVSPEAVLTPDLLRVCRDLADHYAGTLADVLRLAIPPRHARAEKAPDAAPPAPAAERHEKVVGWEPYPAGAALVRRLAAGEGPAAAWAALPDGGSPDGWPAALASAVAATQSSGRGSIVVLPDHRDVDRVTAALDRAVGREAYVRLTADLGPEPRYSAWLRVLRGQVGIVVGSRSAAFAPVQHLGLVAWWDDGDDNLQEPRAPYPHVREVLRRRAALSGAGLIAGGHGRTTEVQAWVESDVLREVRASRAALAAGEGHQAARDTAAASARLPTLAWQAVKKGLDEGPVLVQVPRRGYLVALSCGHCRAPVRCSTCSGPLRLGRGAAVATCGWCGTPDDGRPCRQCGAAARRSRIVGEERTAEEVGRAFPGVRVQVSRAGQVLSTVGERPSVVVATPGAEPLAEGGYAATLLLDGWALLERGTLDSGIEALRRWLTAAALTRSGAPVVLVGVPPHASLPPVEALVRWDPVWLAARELDERAVLGLPPARRTATVTGDPEAVEAARAGLSEEAAAGGLEVLGPLSVTEVTEGTAQLRLVVRESAADPPAASHLPTALRSLRAGRSLRKESGDLLVRLDPPDLDI